MTTDHIELYCGFLRKNFSIQKPLKIIADCSNGTTSIVLKKLGAIPNLELILINDTPDPEFPAHGPNPLLEGATNQLAAKVLEEKADFGVAFDADGDRAFFVDENGELMPSYVVCMLLFKHHKPPYVADEWVYKSLESIKAFSETELFPARVGTFYVKEKMKETQATCAGEFSGHYYYQKFFGSDSGIFSMIVMANIVSTLTESLSGFMGSLPQHVIKNDDLKLGNKTWKDIEPHVHTFAEEQQARIETREGLTLNIGETWVNMRPSNTEPLVRLIAGGKTLEEVTDLLAKLKKLV